MCPAKIEVGDVVVIKGVMAGTIGDPVRCAEGITRRERTRRSRN
jgi:hypothetical protein